MKFVNKLSVISLVVLMFSFMNIAQAAQDCLGTAVSFCNQSTTQSACVSTFRPAAPTMECAWDSSTSSCSASGAACYAPACKTTNDCKYPYTCSSNTRNGVYSCQKPA